MNLHKFETVTFGQFSFKIYWKRNSISPPLSIEEQQIIEVSVEEILLEYTKIESSIICGESNEINKLPKKRKPKI